MRVLATADRRDPPRPRAPGTMVALLDGGFVRSLLSARPGRRPTARDDRALADALLSRPELAGAALRRVLYYDGRPLCAVASAPASGARVDFAATPEATHGRRLLEGLGARE